MNKIKQEIVESVVDDDSLCDVSTVININLQNLETPVKTAAVESVSPGSITKEKPVISTHKVANWLLRSPFEKCNQSASLQESEEWMTDLSQGEDTLFLSSATFVSLNATRLRVFLIDVHPNLDDEPLNLISGYCYMSCRQFSQFSDISWVEKGNSCIPTCPLCKETDDKNQLKLMFLVRIHVMDSNGHHSELNIHKEQAEEFLGCSVLSFIIDPAVRQSTVKLLRQYMLCHTFQQKYTPLMDLTIVAFKNKLIVVKSRLKKCTAQ